MAAARLTDLIVARATAKAGDRQDLRDGGPRAELEPALAALEAVHQRPCLGAVADAQEQARDKPAWPHVAGDVLGHEPLEGADLRRSRAFRARVLAAGHLEQRRLGKLAGIS